MGAVGPPSGAGGQAPEERPAPAFEPRPPTATSASRERHGSGAGAGTMAWERAGVVIEPTDPPRGVWTPRRTGLVLLAVALPFVPLAVALGSRVPRFNLWTFALPLLLSLAIYVPMGVFVYLVTRRARAEGRAYVPRWTVGVMVAYYAGVLGLFLVGVLPLHSVNLVMMLVLLTALPMLMPLRGRSGDGLFCAACEYEYVYTDPAGPPAPETCSECGSRWQERGGLIRGRRARPRVGVIASVGALWLLALAAPLLGSRLTTIATTGSLISAVTARQGGFVTREWRELNARALSESQRVRLATGLLDLRLAEENLDADADAWLDAQVKGGTLPTELVERHYRELMDATILAPERCRVGEQVVLGLETVDRSTPFGLSVPLAAIEGYRVDAQPQRVLGRSPQLLKADGMGLRARWAGRDATSPTAPQIALTFDTPGTHRVRCAYWLVVMGQFSFARPIAWNADDTPALPQGVLFSERREIWVDVEVVP